MNKSITPRNSDEDKPTVRDLQNALRVTEADRDQLREERDQLREERDRLTNDLKVSRAKLKESQDTKALFAQLIAFIEEQGNVAYIASLRIALIASAFNAFAWVAAFLLIAFDNPTGAYFAAAGGFGATGILFLLSAFNRDTLERIKNIFVRRRR